MLKPVFPVLLSNFLTSSPMKKNWKSFLNKMTIRLGLILSAQSQEKLAKNKALHVDRHKRVCTRTTFSKDHQIHKFFKKMQRIQYARDRFDREI